MADVTFNERLSSSIKREDFGDYNYKKTPIYHSNGPKSYPASKNMSNGPVENLKDQSAKTQADLSNLVASRTTPTSTAATGQPLTSYHSFFYSLLSWEHPRASGIAYLFTVMCTFAFRYLNVVRYSLKISYVLLGITVLAEIAGKFLFANGFTSQIRPNKYYTVSRETLNLMINDLHELINFFVIQAQQVIFAENLPVSIAAFISSFISYFLVKFVPLWGLFLLGTSALFLGSLIYKINQESIDYYVSNTVDLINQQTEKLKSLASEQAARATKSTKALVGDYSSKAQGMISSRSPSRQPAKINQNEKISKQRPMSSYQAEDFPKVPNQDVKSTKAVDDLASSSLEDQNLILA